MEDSAAQTTETTVDNSSSVDVLDSYDLSKPDGGLGTTSDNDNDSQESQRDDDDRSADSVEQQTDTESEDGAKGASDNPDNMSEAERTTTSHNAALPRSSRQHKPTLNCLRN